MLLQEFEYRPIVAIDSCKRIIWVSPAGQPPIHKQGVAQILAGPAAHYLYAAVTGHWMNQSPDQTTAITANSARAVIQQRAQLGDNYLTAHQVVQQWGYYIRPWLGVCLFDSKTGQPINDASEYHKMINLFTMQILDARQQFEVLLCGN